jgi:hypothetical protein
MTRFRDRTLDGQTQASFVPGNASPGMIARFHALERTQRDLPTSGDKKHPAAETLARPAQVSVAHLLDLDSDCQRQFMG